MTYHTRGRKRNGIQVVILCIISGLIIWHVIHWHSEGMYLEMFEWLKTGKGYIIVLYNLGFMLVLGTTLGFLMGKITDFLDYKGNVDTK